METPNVIRSRKNALKKIEQAKADLEFVDRLKTRGVDHKGGTHNIFVEA